MVSLKAKTFDKISEFLTVNLLCNIPKLKHIKRVITVSLSLGREIGLCPDELKEFNWAALLNDIGKITVDPEIFAEIDSGRHSVCPRYS